MNVSDKSSYIIDVIIPAYNEEEAIGNVISEIPSSLVRHIIVANNGSTDKTAQNSEKYGAIVVHEPTAGYGRACLKGLDYISHLEVKPDVVVFLDGDYSDYPEQMHDLVYPIIAENYDLVIGSRVKGNQQKGSMTAVQIFGNWLATNLIKLLYNYDFTDLGPFRAIKYKALINMDMRDQDFGWTVEMQIKAAKLNLKCTEIAADYRRRIGKSKVSGTIKGSILAGHKILWTLFKLM